mgnify:CR=1 FL=1
MSLRTPPLLVTLLVLLSQVAFAACGSGLALCHEADGGVSIEWSGAECCTPPDATPASGPELVGGGDCDGCEDGALDLSQRLEPLPASLPPPARISGLPRWVCPSPPPPSRGAVRARGGPPLEFLRTIVIRC